MIKTTLADFFTKKTKEHMNMDDPCDNHKLYIIRDNLDQVLYIGIARHGISKRWFHYNGGHMSMQLKNNHYVFTPSLSSDIGQYIYDMLPTSLDWIIEMWSLNDCIEFLKAEAIDRFRGIEGAEQLMIHKLEPYFNVHYNSGASSKEWDIKHFWDNPHPYYCIWDGSTPINMVFAKHPHYDNEDKADIFDTLVVY